MQSEIIPSGVTSPLLENVSKIHDWLVSKGDFIDMDRDIKFLFHRYFIKCMDELHYEAATGELNDPVDDVKAHLFEGTTDQDFAALLHVACR